MYKTTKQPDREPAGARLNICIQPSMLAAVQELADQHDRSVSAMTRLLIADALRRMGREASA